LYHTVSCRLEITLANVNWPTARGIGVTRLARKILVVNETRFRCHEYSSWHGIEALSTQVARLYDCELSCLHLSFGSHVMPLSCLFPRCLFSVRFRGAPECIRTLWGTGHVSLLYFALRKCSSTRELRVADDWLTPCSIDSGVPLHIASRRGTTGAY
jgi:hypothetical protein